MPVCIKMHRIGLSGLTLIKAIETEMDGWESLKTLSSRLGLTDRDQGDEVNCIFGQDETGSEEKTDLVYVHVWRLELALYHLVIWFKNVGMICYGRRSKLVRSSVDVITWYPVYCCN